MSRRIVAAVLAVAVVAVPAPGANAAPGPPAAPMYWFDNWGVQALWDGGARGQGMTIAVIDTGVNAALPELRGRILAGKDFSDNGGDGRIDRDIDAFGHGTGMASLIVATPGAFNITGLAPDSRVLPIAVPLRGTTFASSSDRVPEAIRWAVDHGSKIVSLSLGGRRSPTENDVPCSDRQQDAVNYAISKGAIVVAASGNAGNEGSPVEEPGVCLGVISVGAVDANNQVASFSSRHPYLTMVAPGVQVATLGRVGGDGYFGNGTSHATAITAAVLALVWSKHPKLTGRQVVARVLATLDEKRPLRDAAYGYGIVNAGRAVTASVPSTAPNPVFDAVDPFLARERAVTGTPAPPRVTRGPAPMSAPAAHDPASWPQRMVTGAVITIVGLCALLVLGVVGFVRGRRFAQAVEAGEPVVLEGVENADEAGIVWHDVHLKTPVWPPKSKAD